MSFVYKGAVHIHTTFSDGHADIETIARTAKKAGLNFIVISDHNNLKGREFEGFIDGVAVIVAEEISPSIGNHYLAMDTQEAIGGELEPEDSIAEVYNQGGFGFIAHPDENPNRKNNYRPLRWQDWSIENFGGLEIWNALADWVDNYDSKKMVQSYLMRDYILNGPTEDVLKWFDELNLKSDAIVPAVGGVDAHALKYRVSGLPVEVFSYKYAFETVINYIYLDDKLPDDFTSFKKGIYQALKEGRSVIANRRVGKDLPSFCVCNSKHKVDAGGTIELDKQTYLQVKLPKKADIRLLYDGQLIWQYEAKELLFDKLDRGKYRFEVYYKGRPWMFSNPIKVI